MKSIIKIKISFLSIILLSSFLFSQTSPPDTTKLVQPDFTFAADWNRYSATDSMIYLEYTLALHRRVLTFKLEESSHIAEFLVEAEIANGDSVIGRQAWRSRDQVENLDAGTVDMVIPIINSFILHPGSYNLKIKLIDVFGEDRSKSVTFPIKAERFNKKLSLSDVQCAGQILRDNSDNDFVKNGYKVLPNPSAVYGLEMPILYSYFEIYNLSPTPAGGEGKYSISYKILDADGAEAKSFPDQIRTKPGASSVAINNLNVVTLISGAYTLQVQVTDLDVNQSVSNNQKFFIYREADFAQGGASFQKKEVEAGQGQGSPGFDANRYDALSEEELDHEFDTARYLAKGDERKTWKKLELEGKRDFIKEFWSRRDNTLGTPANEFKNEYLGRAKIANTMYRGTFVEGWKSDRGRVLLVYDKPDEIERFPGGSDTKEYHVWHYYAIQGGVYFVFADKRAMGDLELVHTTARGELFDSEWRRWIKPDY
jgi:GWxTD domain-containing protein